MASGARAGGGPWGSRREPAQLLAPAAALEAIGLTCEPGGRRVLVDVSLRVGRGEILGVVGPNGSGKTTLLRALAGLLKPAAGVVAVARVPLASLSPRERALRVAYLPQLREVPAGFRSADLVEMGRHPHTGETDSAMERAVRAALDAVGAAELAGRRLETLSGGELQRVFLASVVAQETPVLLLDEPTVFLDPGRAAEIMAELVGLAARGRALVVATHDLAFAAGAATRVLALRDGRSAFEGPPSQVFTAERLAELFGAGFGGWRGPAAIADRGGAVIIERSAREAALSAGERSAREAAPLLGERAARHGVPALQPRDQPLVTLVAVALLVLVAAPFAGSLPANVPGEGAASDRAASFILWQLRVPRVVLAGVAGGGLALAGAAFQALFRNPLATPYTLGVAGGAALGAVLALVAGAAVSAWGGSGASLGALAGALATSALVYGLGRRRRALPTPTLLLAGVTLSYLAGALILLLQYLADFTQTFRVLRWLMGEVRIVGWSPLIAFAPPILAGAWLILGQRAELNLLLTGEELASARGVDVERVKRRLLFGSSFLVGSVVALCGPIGFVGLVVPHVLRVLLGADHRRLALACIPAGAVFLVACDTVARLVLSPVELPVGVLTALVGGPFFLGLLLRARSAFET